MEWRFGGRERQVMWHRLTARDRTLLLLSGLIAVMAALELATTESLSSGQVSPDAAAVGRLKADLRRQRRRLAAIEEAQRYLSTRGAMSLPSDPGVASTLYQNWLLGIIESCRLNSVVVTPHRSHSDSSGYTIIPYSVRVSGTLGKLRRFMRQFARAPMLHRIVNASLETSRHTGDPSLDCRMQVEAIALSAARHNGLPRGALTDPQRSVGNEAYKYRNPFVSRRPVEDPVAAAVPEPVERPAPPPTPWVRFVGIVNGLQGREAMLFDYGRNQTVSMAAEQTLERNGTTLAVISIGDSELLIKVDSRCHCIRLGDDLLIDHSGKPAQVTRLAR